MTVLDALRGLRWWQLALFIPWGALAVYAATASVMAGVTVGLGLIITLFVVVVVRIGTRDLRG